MRKNWLTLHLCLAGLFLPFFITIPLSGTFYLLGNKGSVKRTVAFSVPEPFTKDRQKIEGLLKANDIDFDFEYIKDRKKLLVLRPATRDHYEVVRTDSGMDFVKVEPDWIKVLQEMHFGHGPTLIKKLQIAFGIGFLFVVTSGFFLMIGLKKHIPIVIGSLGLGVLTFVLGFLI
jgi:hypothetical protein